MSLIRTNNRTLDGNQGRRNLVYNGKFQLAQRGTDFDTITTNDYCLDRWTHVFSGLDGNYDVDQSTTVPTAQGFSNSIKISMDASETSLDAADYATVQQYFEGQDLQHLLKGTTNAKKLCLSFWVRSSVASTYTVELKDSDNGRNIGKSYTISTADTWEKKVIVFDADTTGTFNNDNGLSLQLIFWIDAGSNFTSGTFSTAWQAQANTERVYDTTGWLESTSPEFYLTGVQMEVGDSPSDFEHRTYGEELSLCQRYFYSNLHTFFGMPPTSSTVQVATSIQYPVEMRANPSFSSSGTPKADPYIGASITASSSSIAFFNTSKLTAAIQFSNFSGLNTNHPYNVQDVTVKLDAEL